MRIPTAVARALALPLLLAAPLVAVLTLPAAAEVGIAGLRLVAADAGGITLEYKLPEPRLEPVTTEAGTFTRVRVAGLASTAEEGKPELPAGGIWVALPPVGAVSVRVLDEETATVPGVDVVPVPRSLFVPDGAEGARPAREFFRDPAAYATDASFPGPLAALESPSWIRFQRVAALRLFPVRYRAASRTLLVTRRMVVRVDFAAPPALGETAMGRSGLVPGPADDRQFESIYRSAVVNYQQGRAWRARPPRRPAVTRAGGAGAGRTRAATDLGLGTGNPEWKARVDSTGVWRVSFEQLAARGWPGGIGVDAVTAFRRDTTVALEPEPWTATEIPIDLVDRNGNGTFDSGDFLVLPTRNWADRVSPAWYERRYGDAEVAWLSYKSAGSGLRVRRAPGWLGAVAPARPTSFPSARRYERNFFYFSFPTDVAAIDQFYWTNGNTDAFGTPIDTLFADLLDLDPAAGSVRVGLQWIGVSDQRHRLTAEWVNGSGQATSLFADTLASSRTVFNAPKDFPADQATPGVNRLRIQGFREGDATPGSGAAFNSFTVTYPRLYRARNDRLDFTSGSASDTVEFVVDGFTGVSAPAIYAYDVTDYSDPVRLAVDPAQVEAAGGGWRARLQAVVAPGAPRSYVAAAVVRPLPDAAITAVVPPVTRLFDAAPGQADFLIVTYDGFADAVEPLAAFRRSQDIPTLVARTQEIYDEFNGGRKSHFAIRRFLAYALAHWDTRAVLLVGDASEDAQGWLGTSARDYLPVPVIPGPVPISTRYFTGTEVVPSDNWYVFGLTGAESPGTSVQADMVIGRWSVGDNSDGTRGVDQTRDLVAKSIAYETVGLADAWRNRAVLIADDDYSTDTFFGGGGGGTTCYCEKSSERVFQGINQSVDRLIRQEAGYRDFDVEPFYLSDLLPAFTTFPCGNCSVSRDFFTVDDYVNRITSPSLFVLLTEGAAFVNFQGHGNAQQMTHEELYVSQGSVQDIDLIMNDGMPWMFSGFACHLNAFARVTEGTFFGDGLGERMVNVARKGAIGSFASVGYELLPFNPDAHLNVYFHGAFFLDPPYGEFAGRSGARVRIGEAALTGVLRMVANTYSLERQAARTYVLLGDPLAAMNFGPPRFFVSTSDRDSLANAQIYYPSADADTVQVDAKVLDESAIDSLSVVELVTEPGGGARRAVPDSELVITPGFPDSVGNRYTVTRRMAPRPESYDVVYKAADRSGLASQFALRFVLEVSLTQGGQTVRNGDPVLAGEALVWKVHSPARLAADDFSVLVDHAPFPSTATRDPADTTGRTWRVEFHPQLTAGPYEAALAVAPARGGPTRVVQFVVPGDGLKIRSAYAFPNPFREFTTFNFILSSNQVSDVVLRVFAVDGTLVYERYERGLAPGYHQWQWDGRDQSGKVVAFGAYIYRLASAAGGSLKTALDGKVVRAPLKAPVPTSGAGP